jgi:cytochrome c-type biogenesis protein CcmH
VFIRVIRVLFFITLLTLAGTAFAQEPVTDDEVNEVAKELYCPVCESTPLDVCPTQACADWRDLIRTQLSEGQSRQEILDYFARQYGNGVLADPPREGISLLLLWLLPVAAIALGVLFFSRYLRSLKAATAESAARQATNDKTTHLEPYISRIEQELQEGRSMKAEG